MKTMFVGLLAGLLTTSVLADVKFTCSYSDVYKIQKGSKIKTKYGKPVVRINGKLSENDGGTLSIKSDYLYGTNSKQGVKFYRHNREGESGLKFAKFHNKTQAQLDGKAWLPTYLKFSLPKKSLEGEEKEFPAYFGYFRAKEDVSKIGADDPQATAVEVTEDDLKEFAKENEKSLEYKLWCKKSFI